MIVLTLQIRSGEGRITLISNPCSRLLHLDVSWHMVYFADWPDRFPPSHFSYGLKSSGAPKGTLSFFKDACNSAVFGPNTLYSTQLCTPS